jgi:hypothetical protein
LSVTLTYTTTHGSRAPFLDQVLNPCGELGATTGVDARYEIRVGRYRSGNASHRQDPMDIGSRLLFHIDRGRARKRLESLVRRADAVVLLKWAAAGSRGQCTLLQVGSNHLIITALKPESSISMRPSVRLDELVGREGGRAVLMVMLAIVSTSLANHDSPRLINEQIDAVLLDYRASADHAMLTAAADHVTFVLALLARIRATMARCQRGSAGDTTVPTAYGNNGRGARVETARTAAALSVITSKHAPASAGRGSIALALEQAATTWQRPPADQLRAALLDNSRSASIRRSTSTVSINARSMRCMPASSTHCSRSAC